MNDIFIQNKKSNAIRMVSCIRMDSENVVKGKLEPALFLHKEKEEGGLRTKGHFKKNLQNKPLITIITVVFNGEDCLEKTILSVLEQSYSNIEYIVIDGRSTDHTLDIIRKYEHVIDYWVSEKDKGIYDAMNKGCKLAYGKGLNFLNAGDYYIGDLFNCRMVFPFFVRVETTNYFGKKKILKLKSYKQGLPYCHQGIFFENKGLLYSLQYEVSADYDYFLAHNYNDKIKFLDSLGYIYYDNNGFSKVNETVRDRELFTIINRNFGYFYARSFKFKQLGKNFIKKLVKLL